MEEEWRKTLPDDLVERIIARVPFPYIFQARCLSKSWLARFSSVSSLQDVEMKGRAIAFQKLVRERSKNWVTLSPVLIDQIAYNGESHTWHRMPSLRNLPWTAKSTQRIIGPLLFAARRPEARFWSEVNGGRGEVSQRPHLYDISGAERPTSHQLNLNLPTVLYVANMLTRSWKLLPPRPNAGLGYAFCETLVINPSSETYMVISFCRDGICYSAQTYDSKSATWSSNELGNPRYRFICITSHAYFNGVIYMVPDALVDSLLAYDVEARTWKELTLENSFDEIIEASLCIHLLVCNSNLMMLVQVCESPEVEGLHRGLHVLKVDLELLQLWKLARYHAHSLNLSKLAAPPVSDGRCISLGADKFDRRMVAIYVDESVITLKEKKKIMKMKMKKKMQDEDDGEEDEDEDKEDEDWEEDEDEPDEGDFAPEWNCLLSPPSPQMTTSDLRNHEIPSTGQGAKMSREPTDKTRNYVWCGPSFQPGLNPFMEV